MLKISSIFKSNVYNGEYKNHNNKQSDTDFSSMNC